MKTVMDIVRELGWAETEGRAATQRVKNAIRGLGLQVGSTPSTTGGAKALTLNDKDASALIGLLKEQPPPKPRVFATPEPAPVLQPIADKPLMGFQPAKSLEQEFSETCRKIIHLIIKLDDDREVIINKDGAEINKMIRVEKKDFLKP